MSTNHTIMTSPYRTIMLIDDDLINNLLNRQFLTFTMPAATITTIQNAAVVIDYIKKGKIVQPDLILLDINMPEMDGWEFVHQLEALGRTSDIIILSSSIHADDIHIAQTKDSIKGYIHKPLTEEKIEQHIILQQFSLLGLD